MTSKQAIVSELGGEEVLVPDLIARSLVANDQAKYYFALLQAARANADRRRVPSPDLKAERLASRIPDAWLDDVVAGAAKDRPGFYRIPNAPEILHRIGLAIELMLECLPEARRAPFLARLRQLEPPKLDDEAISRALIDAIASGDRKAGDSLHLLVMDAHRAVNTLQDETAVETFEGARIHRLTATGRRRVKAFMDGLNRTAPLKFDHPGLGTTATEHEGRVLIQNDIGTTDAHVLVLRVRDLTAIVTYSDIHRPRLAFFKSLFESFAVAWEGTDQRKSEKVETGGYLLATGTFTAKDEAELEGFLAHLGSRIVFLIDWNRMRKRLRAFVGKDQAVAVLKWAADNDFGHRGLIELGGEGALAEAIEYAAGKRLRYGDRLDGLIDEASARNFLQFALKTASVGLRRRRSRRNILDEIKAKLRGSFENARLRIFDTAAAHAACGYDLAFALREALGRVGSDAQRASISRFAARAVEWESTADRFLNEAREDIRRFERPQSLLDFFEFADDAVDELEETAALVDLCGLVVLPDPALARRQELADLALDGAQGLVKCVECAAPVTRADVRDDLDDFLNALEELVAIEHRADAQLRDLKRWLILENRDQHHVMLVRDLAQSLEKTTDAYAHAGQMLRTYLMNTVIP